jgi:hypothetical protein
MKSSLFYSITKRRLVVDVSGQLLKMGLKSCPETSVTNYQSTLRNISKQRRSHINPCFEGLKNTSMRIKCIRTEIQIHYLLNTKQDSKLHHHDARFSFENEINLRFFGCFLKKVLRSKLMLPKHIFY